MSLNRTPGSFRSLIIETAQAKKSACRTRDGETTLSVEPAITMCDVLPAKQGAAVITRHKKTAAVRIASSLLVSFF